MGEKRTRRSGPDEEGGDLVPRHLGPDADQQQAMLDVLGLATLDELTDQAVPSSIRSTEPLRLPAARTEAEALTRLRELASKNEVLTSLIGMGYADTVTPTVILRNVLENPAWYTAYTPYQPEISQGRLEALLNFQTMVSDLTAMELANASLLDEGTAAAEAMAMCRRLTKTGDTFFVDAECHPQTIAVVQTRAEPLDIAVIVGDPDTDVPSDGVFGVLLQYPGTSGALRDDAALVERLHAQGALVTVAADLLALVLVRPPGEIGADVIVGNTQRYRGPARVRRAPRGLHRHPRRVQAYVAGTPGRRIGRHEGTARAAARAPDP